jgi:hypothetical protein
LVFAIGHGVGHQKLQVVSIHGSSLGDIRSGRLKRRVLG